ncbi:MAG TPA: deoxyribose-phosphate aldolase [Bacteroidales bacterium]|jgi:deoxyribose-phosphate aldolase|nr:deoxyribose-phosphate aldolase [Bacteroidales bacterium]HNT92448.1 deoxyribose-phosphate aldolase [Bacteroidales bacterium]HOO65692.1 deoxyribose-phosphate aldolase [Bacteroidales bacterium]HPE21665.1 deoxyribose-phosphate aldolase [Bacteroidales bacterium]HPJ04496.1 deoxyribose-phosphate aldolase [Bacteroidales bacterium]
MSKLYEKLLNHDYSPDEMGECIAEAIKATGSVDRAPLLKEIFSFIDLTSLNTQDGDGSIRSFAERTAHFRYNYPGISNVAALCVYPNFVNVAKEGLADSGVKLAVVSASFPTSQTFTEVKVLETSLAVRMGADEIDVVIPVGIFLEGAWDQVIDELKAIRGAAGDTTLKVILETGLLKDERNIFRASIIAMESGADFIKTSTGKISVSATPEAAWVMCCAIRDYYNETGIMIGFKPAGGIVTPDDALVYYFIVRNVLGQKWLTPNYFRIGASRLANNILSELYPGKPAYF